MVENRLNKIFNRLLRFNYEIIGPIKEEGEIVISKLDKLPALSLLSIVSDRSYKYFLMPAREVLYKYENKKVKIAEYKINKKVLFGMSIYDLKALELYDNVFKNDVYFKNRKKELFTIGYSAELINKIKTDFFDFDKDILSNVMFDIFIEKTKNDFNFYSGSKKGYLFLRSCGIKAKYIEYNPKHMDNKILKIKKAVENSKNSKLWQELSKICLACGKCTIACPTCFCFDIESKIGPKKEVERTSGNCFYDDFSRIAGGHKFLNNPGEKLYFWYYHKFVRIPFEYGLHGCVDCGRCTKVCPVGIDIQKNIKRLLKESDLIKNKKK